MHDSVQRWVAKEVRAWSLDREDVETFEVGSLDVNGSVRGLFRGPYVGLDLRAGPGVDVVGSSHALPLADAAVDVVVCTEVLEHDPAFWLTLGEIRRVLRSGGHLLLTTRGNGFGEHREPLDLWRFMPQSADRVLELAGCDRIETILDPEVPGIFVHGQRLSRR